MVSGIPRPWLVVLAVVIATLGGCGQATSHDARAAADSAATGRAAPSSNTSKASSAPPVQKSTSHSEPAHAPTPAGPRHVVLGDLNLTGIGYDRGSVTAPVVVIDLSDFACPYCGEFSIETYPAIERDYVKTGKVFFKYVPFVVGSFPHSREATRAAEFAADQGGFWPMMKLIYEPQPEWKRGGDPYALLSGIVSVAGLDTARLGQCYASKRTDARTARASNLASDLGVRVTPSSIVNERPIQGALPLADFRKVVDAALMVARLKK